MDYFKKKNPDILVVDMYAAFWVAIEAYITTMSQEDKNLRNVRHSLEIMTSDILTNLKKQGWK